MKFEWHEEKNKLNVQKHGFNFLEAAEMFNKPMVVKFDKRKEYGEERYIGLGKINKILAVVVYTKRSSNKTRIISLRKANKREIKKFESFKN